MINLNWFAMSWCVPRVCPGGSPGNGKEDGDVVIVPTVWLIGRWPSRCACSSAISSIDFADVLFAAVASCLLMSLRASMVSWFDCSLVGSAAFGLVVICTICWLVTRFVDSCRLPMRGRPLSAGGFAELATVAALGPGCD